MLREAELFVMAEDMLVEVLGRIRDPDLGILLPAMYPGADQPMTMAQALEQHIRSDAEFAATLGDTATPGATPAEVAKVACAAASQVADGDALIHTGHGDVTIRDHLLRTTVERSLLAHYVAAYLGSTACPLPEELARPLWELTAPDAATWRGLGYFRAPMPLPDHVSWRDRFLLTAGHEPHPLGH